MNGILAAVGVISLTCNIKLPDSDVNWEALKPYKWYQVLHSSNNDPLMDKDIRCSVLSDIDIKSSDDITFNVTEYVEGYGPLPKSPMHNHRLAKGIYRVEKASFNNMDWPKLEGNGNRKWKEETENFRRRVFDKSDIVRVSDGKNFLHNIWCDGDDYIVWSHFPTTTPSAKQLIAAWNALTDMGICVKMSRSCAGYYFY